MVSLDKMAYFNIHTYIVRYGLKDRCLNPGEGESFSLHHDVQTGFGTHLPSYILSTGELFPRV